MFFNIALAQGLKGAGAIAGQIAKDAGADTYTSPQELIGTGINAALTMVGLIFLILMIYAGYLWLTAHGEEEPVKKAQKIIVSSVIGFILVASAYAITVFVGKRFETGSGGVGGTGKEDKEVVQQDEKPICCQKCTRITGFTKGWQTEYLATSEGDCNLACGSDDNTKCQAEAVNADIAECTLDKLGNDCTDLSANVPCEDNDGCDDSFNCKDKKCVPE